MEHVKAAFYTGRPMKIEMWKKLVHEAICNKDIERWKISSRFFKSLNVLNKEIISMQILPWWTHALYNPRAIWKVKVIVRLLLDVNKVNRCTFKYNNESNTARCRKCNSQDAESVQHVLFDCQSTRALRESLWTKVRNVALPNLISSIEIMPSDQKLSFVLNAFRCKYIIEWSKTYEVLLDYIVYVYNNHTRDILVQY